MKYEAITTTFTDSLIKTDQAKFTTRVKANTLDELGHKISILQVGQPNFRVLAIKDLNDTHQQPCSSANAVYTATYSTKKPSMSYSMDDGFDTINSKIVSSTSLEELRQVLECLAVNNPFFHVISIESVSNETSKLPYDDIFDYESSNSPM